MRYKHTHIHIYIYTYMQNMYIYQPPKIRRSESLVQTSPRFAGLCFIRDMVIWGAYELPHVLHCGMSQLESAGS